MMKNVHRHVTYDAEKSEVTHSSLIQDRSDYGFPATVNSVIQNDDANL